MSYIILTPVKNEAKTIKNVIASVVCQSVQPVLWVIIDGNSTDRTREILTELTEHIPWIRRIHQRKFSDRGSHANVALAMQEAYEYATKYCEHNNITFDYVWTIDGDQMMSMNTCGGIVEKMQQDTAIGAASGKVFNPDGSIDTYPPGELSNKRVYKRVSLEAIGGFPYSDYSFDTVILAKLRMRGYKIVAFPEFTISNLRSDSGIERNAWKSAVQFGKARYYLGYSLPLMVMGCGYMAMKLQIVKALGVAVGYLPDYIFGKDHIPDVEIWKHFRYDRLKEVLK